MSRPKKIEAEKKRVLVQLRTTDTDKKLLFEYAKTAGMNVTDFVKARTLGKPPRTKMATPDRQIFIQFLAELAKIGSNVNQIARAMNTQQKPFYSVKIKEVVIAESLEKLKTVSSVILEELYNFQKLKEQPEQSSKSNFSGWSHAEK